MSEGPGSVSYEIVVDGVTVLAWGVARTADLALAAAAQAFVDAPGPLRALTPDRTVAIRLRGGTTL